jgi:hypothetical protein
MNCLAQRLELAVGQVAPLPARDGAQLQRTDARANQLEDRVADLVEHASHDPVAPLVDDNAHDRAIFDIADRPDDLGPSQLAVDGDPAAEALQHRSRRMSVQQRLILLVNAIAWMHDPVREFAVVGQQKQPLCLTVEPPNRHDALVGWHQIHDRPAPALVVHRGDVAARLVEDDIAASRVRDQHPIHFDLLALRVDLGAKFGDDMAVDSYPTREDHLLRLAPRCHPARGQHTLQSFQSICPLGGQSSGAPRRHIARRG